MLKKIHKFPLFLPAISGILVFLSYPANLFHFGFLAWIAFVPVLLYLNRCSGVKDVLWSFLFIITLGLLIGIGFWPSLTVYYELPAWKAALVVFFFIAILGGVHYFIFFFLAYYFKKTGLLRPLLLSFVWIALEFLYSKISLQARTYLIGYSQYNIPLFVPILRAGGIYAAGFFIMFFNLLVTEWVSVFKNRNVSLFRYGVISSIFIALFFGISALNSGENTYIKNRPFKTALLQSNMGHELKWSSDYYGNQIERLIEMTKKAADFGAQLIAWPSTSVIIQGKDILPEILAGLTDHVPEETKIFIGARLFMPQKDGFSKFNSILLCDSKGNIFQMYLKKILMPYGEYLPFGSIDIFGKKKYFPDTYTASKKDYTVFDVFGRKICTPICLEILYSELIRHFIKNGADTILTFSNDDSYISQSFPYYFLCVTAMKAVEFGVPVLRETVNGISAVIDSEGVIVKRSVYGKEDILVYNFNLPANISFYAKYGDWFSWICVLLTIICVPIMIVHNSHIRRENEIS